MIVRVDIDGTICTTTGVNYLGAVPKLDRIAQINQVYDAGHTVIYWTARGQGSGYDWYNETLSQLRAWGCRFSALQCTKPIFDVFIDDKAFNADTAFAEAVVATQK